MIICSVFQKGRLIECCTIGVGVQYTSKNTNNVSMTCFILQTNGGSDKRLWLIVVDIIVILNTVTN
jgi:hypothetical protein